MGFDIEKFLISGSGGLMQLAIIVTNSSKVDETVTAQKRGKAPGLDNTISDDARRHSVLSRSCFEMY